MRGVRHNQIPIVDSTDPLTGVAARRYPVSMKLMSKSYGSRPEIRRNQPWTLVIPGGTLPETANHFVPNKNEDGRLPRKTKAMSCHVERH